MTEDGRAALLAAVNRLVVDTEAARLFEALTDVLPIARRIGVRLSGDLEELNPLLELACHRPDHYDNVMLLVENKREQAGLAALDPKRTQVEKFDKTAYQAEFMQRKRVRERRAVDVENLMRPDRDRLIGRARLDFMQAQSARWKVELDEKIEEARLAAGTRLTKDHLDVIRRDYWDQVDRDLDELETLARQPRKK